MEAERIRSLDDYARRSSKSRRPVPDLSRAAVVRRFVVIGGLSVGAYYGLLWVGLSLEAAALFMAVGLVFVAFLVRSAGGASVMPTYMPGLPASSWPSGSMTRESEKLNKNVEPLGVNPATGQMMVDDLMDIDGNAYGANWDGDDHSMWR